MQGLEAELLVLDCAGASPQLLLNARVVNHGASAVTLNRMPLSFAMLVFDVRHAGGADVPGGPPPVPPTDAPRWHLPLAPNADFSFDAALEDIVATPLTPGAYEIRLDYENAAGPDWTGHLVTGWVAFTLRGSP